jgi:hypothetical protein
MKQRCLSASTTDSRNLLLRAPARRASGLVSQSEQIDREVEPIGALPVSKAARCSLAP